MRVLMIVQEINESHWLRGFIVGWVRALAAEVEHLHVLTLAQYAADLPPNVSVYSMGKEEGKNRLRELRRFYGHLGALVGDVDAIFSHMTPRYTYLAAPFASLHHKPQLLWYTHPRHNWELQLAFRAAKWITTADLSSFPFQSPKVHALGHGIDTERFCPLDIPLADPPMVLAVGRITPAKKHDLLLEVAARLAHIQVVIAGAPAAAGDEAYLASLLRRRDELGLGENRFRLVGALQTDELIHVTRQTSVVTNLSALGYFDKAALEGMLIGKPVLAPNPAFSPLWGDYTDQLCLSDLHPQTIAQSIQGILDLPLEERQEMGKALRARTAEAHSLNSLMKRLKNLIEVK